MAMNDSFIPAAVTRSSDPIIREFAKVTWDRINALSSQIRGPVVGTISPDNKPRNLTQADIGLIFLASDYSREYQWTGTYWTDAPGAPSRYAISYFVQPPDTTGWAQCDGATVRISTSSGDTQAYSTPSIPASNGLVAYMRL